MNARDTTLHSSVTDHKVEVFFDGECPFGSVLTTLPPFTLAESSDDCPTASCHKPLSDEAAVLSLFDLMGSDESYFEFLAAAISTQHWQRPSRNRKHSPRWTTDSVASTKQNCTVA